MKNNTRSLNPLIKFMMLIIFAVLVLFITSATYMLCFVTVAAVSKFVFRARTVATKGVIGFAVVIFLAQVLFVRSGTPVLQAWILIITIEGVKNGILITGKFLSIIMMSWVFVATTAPRDLANAMTAVGIPYRYSFLLVLSMRFVPIFRFELSTVRDAQAIRGLKLGKNLRGLVRSIRYTTVPLLMSALARVNTLAASMEGRGFGAARKKTCLYPITMTARDVVGVWLAAVFAIEVYFANQFIHLW